MKEQDKDRPVSSGLEEIFGSAAVQSDGAAEGKAAPSRRSESPREARDGGRRNRPPRGKQQRAAIHDEETKEAAAVEAVTVTEVEETTSTPATYEVVGVRFKDAGKIYYFAPGAVKLAKGDSAIVETARGTEYGFVAMGNTFVPASEIVPPLRNVIRKADAEDAKRHEANLKKEKEAFAVCLEKIRDHSLEMKLVDAEYTFDNNKLLFYFTADGRIDFRELVKDLAAVFKTRIELRQIGVRDETKILGGVGICGRPLCCHSYLSEFIPVSIKMAKEQNLSLNPTKISGVCGRLMCCLKYEEETYEDLNSHLPSVGDYVTTDDGLKGEVHSVSVLRQQVKVVVTVGRDEKEIRDYRVDQLKFKPKRRRDRGNVNDAELKALEALEKKEGKSKLDDN